MICPGRKVLSILAITWFLAACATKPSALPVQPLPELPMSPGATCNLGARVVTRVEPTYPRSAISVGQHGWVILDYDITAEGAVRNVVVLASSPPHVFEGAAVGALRQWKYAPGSPGEKCRLDFQFFLKD